MVERLNIPNSPACGQWETLLADALDGLLRPEDEATFSNHMATCAPCTEMFEQARRGREWLEFLSPEPEVPAGLLDKILAETGHGKIDTTRLAVAGGGQIPGNVVPLVPAWQRPGLAARLRRFAEPRLLMTAAMAFFSIGLTLSMTGVRITGIKMADLRPSTVRSQLEKRIATASTPIIRYYDHLRFVYEMESTMRQIRQSRETEQQSQPNGQSTSPDGQTKRKDGGSNLNPKDAPQQTVNPPESPWSAQLEEAALETERPLASLSQNLQGFSKHSEASESIDEPVLATPERSKPCLA
ncbi:anti-sigma factor family protein [Acidicapsa dinghuensis]|uniref:Anti-sigma factor family protein n=1 Tax=Acidicapsa dinghuensis TaxID=2218256 RepID=A0ABW1EAJ2_9BACT|nr:zf-HC2 domain-containing protein [Acidicapsa dinghuensis]